MRLMVDLTAGELPGNVNGKTIQEASDELMSLHHGSCRKFYGQVVVAFGSLICSAQQRIHR